MATRLVSIGQAAANALASYLLEQFEPDVNVITRWPEPGMPLFAPRVLGGPPSRAVVTVLNAGQRTQMDAWGLWRGPVQMPPQTGTGQPLQVQQTFLYGGLEQPMQMDVWASTDVDRDDVIAQLDEYLYAGYPTTLGIVGDPVRDGILLQLAAADGWAGTYVDYWFDIAEMDDNPTSVQVDEFRATYIGEARMSAQQTQSVPLMTSLTLEVQGSNLPTPPAGTPVEAVTLVAPPPGKVIYSWKTGF